MDVIINEVIQCNKCLNYLQNGDFYRRESAVRMPCKSCHKSYMDSWRDKNKNRNAVLKKKWAGQNIEKVRVQKAAWKSRNKKYFADYERTRRREDIEYRMISNIRARLGQAIRNNQKAGSAINDIGCTISQLKKYIESKFQPGMSWDNYGYRGWHIDHILPLSSFDLTNRDQFLQAVHYTNLQPLWAKDNLRKSDRCTI